MGEIFDLLDSVGAVQTDGSLSPLILFSNNLNACATMMLYGLFPFLTLSAAALGTNAMVLGAMGAWYGSQNLSPLLYVALILPHGIFELPAMLLAIATGLYLTKQVTRIVLGTPHTLSFFGCVLLSARTTMLVLFPLLLCAALVEAYITPLVGALFL